MRIPTPVQRGAPVGSVTVDPLQPVFENVQFANPQETAQNLGRLGQAFDEMAGQIAQKRDRVATRGAQQAWHEFEREIADPQSGLYTQQGINASGLTDQYTELAKKKREEIIAQYGGQMATGSGRMALEEMIDQRTQALWGTVATHEASQLDGAERAQIAATIEFSTDRASTFWNDDSEFESSIVSTIGAAEDLNEGMEKEAMDEAVQAETTKVVVSRAERLLQHAPDRVEAFVQGQVDAGRMDQTVADQWLKQNETNIIASKARVLVDLSEGDSTPLVQVSDPVRGTPVDTFLSGMIQSESSGRPDASVTIDDGRIFSGLGGVGERRLIDMKTAGVVPEDMTLAEFASKENVDMQMDALRWHIQDIDKVIDATGALGRGYSRDGLRAVAHLGGITGMRRFINSGGRYNPDDSYTQPSGERTEGTSLTDYYNKFSGAAGGGMTADERIAQETDPRVREAAFEALDSRRQRQYRADERLAQQVTTSIITDYETSVRDGTPFDLSEALARDGVVEVLGAKADVVRDYVRRQQTGSDLPTQPEAVQTIERLIQENPQEFVESNLIANFSDQLSNADMKSYLQEQTRISSQLNAPPDKSDPWSRSEASTLVKGVAIANGVPDTVVQNRILQQALLATRLYQDNNNGAKMSDGQLSSIVRQLAAETTVANFDPVGAFGADDQVRDAKFQDVLKAADAQDISEFFDGLVDLELTYQTPSGPVNHKVTPEEFKSAYRYIYQINRAAPSPSEVITALQLYPPEDIEGSF